MLADHHDGSESITNIEVVGSVIGRTQGAGIVVPAPLDYVSWTQHLDHFLSRKDLQTKDRIILLRGRLTPMAREELVRLGWWVREYVTG